MKTKIHEFRIISKVNILLIILPMMMLLLESCTTDCPRCKGIGVVVETVIEKGECSSCNGSGNEKCNEVFTNKGFMSTTTYKCVNGKYRKQSGSGTNTGQLAGNTCDKCNGTGYVECNRCDGKGITETSRKVDVDCARCEGKGRVSKF